MSELEWFSNSHTICARVSKSTLREATEYSKREACWEVFIIQKVISEDRYIKILSDIKINLTIYKRNRFDNI